jgi:hypothetical protein
MSENSEKNNLLNFIATTLEVMRDRMATKDDLKLLATKDDLEELRSKMATKDDLKLLATKDELYVQIAAVRGDIEQVHLRLDSIEKALTARLSQIEAEVSRLRSVVYLLAKDKPELLRLLG